MALRLNHLLCAVMFFGVSLSQGYAREDILGTEVQTLVREADSCRMNNNLYRALKIYEEAYKHDASIEILRKIIQCHYERGSYQQCIDLYRTVSSDSLTVMDLKMKFFCFSNIAQGDSAVHYGRLANSADPYDCKIVSKLAHHYNAVEQPDTALYIADHYCRIDSTNVFVNRQKAHSLYLIGDYPKALYEYSRLKNCGDRNESTLYYLALCYAKVDSLKLAYGNLLEAAELNRYENPSILSQLGTVAVELGIITDGIGYIEKSIELMQPDSKLMFALTNTLAEGYFKWGKYDKSISYMKQSMKYPYSNVFVYYRMAQAYGMMKKLRDEQKYYQLFVDKAQKEASPSRMMEECIGYATRRINEITEELFFRGGTVM